MRFDKINEGKENFDALASQLLSREGNGSDAVIKSTDKTQATEKVSDASQAESAKAFSASNANIRGAFAEQAPESQQTVLSMFSENMITAEDVAALEKKFGRPLETLRVMSMFSEVADNPIKAMSELNRMIMDVQKS